MNLGDRARMILGLIKLKEAIYARRSGWTEADRAEFLDAIQIALAPHAETHVATPATITLIWKNDNPNE